MKPLTGVRLKRGGVTAKYWYTDGPLDCRFEADDDGEGGGFTELLLRLTGDDFTLVLGDAARSLPGLERELLESLALATEARRARLESRPSDNDVEGAVAASESILSLSLGMARGPWMVLRTPAARDARSGAGNASELRCERPLAP